MELGTRQSDQLAVKIARMFFGQQLAKTEIAQRLGISRFRVARLIDDALARGLVTIRFQEPEGLATDLGAALGQRFGLALCLVVRPVDGDGGSPLPLVARHAAGLLLDLLGPNEVLGVSWGSTVAATVNALPAAPIRGAHVVQLAGGTRRVASGHAPSELAQRLANRLGATLHPLYAPALVDSAALRDALLAEPEVRATVALYDRVDLALVGIGAFAAATEGASLALIASGALTNAEIASAVARGAVADLVLHAVAADGSPVPTALEERAIAVSIDQLRRIPRVIAVAAGAAKAPAIAAILRTGIVSILVTDEAAAEAVMAS